MDFEVYKGIIDSLKDFPDPIRVIRLYKEGEPLVNPRFADMVRYAKQSPKVLRVDTTTNASLLTPERSLEIIDAGLDRLNISVEGMNAEQYRDFSGHKMDYQKYNSVEYAPRSRAALIQFSFLMPRKSDFAGSRWMVTTR